MVETALYSGLRISELLGLIWADLDLGGGLIRMRAQLSCPHRGEPAQRVATKTPASVRDPAASQLADRLAVHRRAAPFPAAARLGLRYVARHSFGERNVARRVLKRAADDAGLNEGGRPALRFHDLRHTFESPDRRPRARRSPRQPHPRTRQHHRHARRLHPPLRRRQLWPRDPSAHGGQSVRRLAQFQPRGTRRGPPPASFREERLAEPDEPRALCLRPERRSRWAYRPAESARVSTPTPDSHIHINRSGTAGPFSPR